MLGIERNKDPELSAKERNTSQFVILDDRKHGRAGKFPVFYDIDTGDYLEPPEGFLADPTCQTLKEWYDLHPEQKDGGSNHDALSPLSEDNSVKQYSDLTQDDIPPNDDEGSETEEGSPEPSPEPQEPTPVAHNYDEPEEYEEDDDDAPF